MDTQLLIAFTCVAQQQSFSLAAHTLGLTQSAVSKRIAILEKQLSHSLFDRVGRQIFLTEAGRTLLPRAKHILDAIADTQRLMEQQTGTVTGELRLATSHHIGIHRLPEVLKHFTQQHPNVHLQIHFIDSEKANNAIINGDYDLAVITLPNIPKEDGSQTIQLHSLWHDPMDVVTNHQHPLTQQKNISIKDLSEYPAILPDITTRTTGLIKDRFTQNNQPLNITMTTNHLDAIKMMVSVGLGWSMLPSTLVDSSLRKLAVKKMIVSRELGCIHHRQRALSNAARAMLHCLQKHAKQK